MDDDDELITVCDRCSQASCWQGIFLCQGSRDANIKQLTRRELRDLDLESPDYWKTDEQLANE